MTSEISTLTFITKHHTANICMENLYKVSQAQQLLKHYFNVKISGIRLEIFEGILAIGVLQVN